MLFSLHLVSFWGKIIDGMHFYHMVSYLSIDLYRPKKNQKHTKNGRTSENTIHKPRMSAWMHFCLDREEMEQGYGDNYNSQDAQASG